MFSREKACALCFSSYTIALQGPFFPSNSITFKATWSPYFFLFSSLYVMRGGGGQYWVYLRNNCDVFRLLDEKATYIQWNVFVPFWDQRADWPIESKYSEEYTSSLISVFASNGESRGIFPQSNWMHLFLQVWCSSQICIFRSENNPWGQLLEAIDLRIGGP